MIDFNNVKKTLQYAFRSLEPFYLKKIIITLDNYSGGHFGGYFENGGVKLPKLKSIRFLFCLMMY